MTDFLLSINLLGNLSFFIVPLNKTVLHVTVRTCGFNKNVIMFREVLGIPRAPVFLISRAILINLRIFHDRTLDSGWGRIRYLLEEIIKPRIRYVPATTSVPNVIFTFELTVRIWYAKYEYLN